MISVDRMKYFYRYHIFVDVDINIINRDTVQSFIDTNIDTIDVRYGNDIQHSHRYAHVFSIEMDKIKRDRTVHLY